jgi:two-component system chemotaxis response regulator CheB
VIKASGPKVSLADLVQQRIEIVAIGSSTGGPNALADIFSKLPQTFPVPIVLTQHMPPLFTRLLAERLSTVSGVKVHEAKDGDVLEAGNAYLAPGDHHLTLVRDGGAVRVALNQEAPENSCRPAVDPMLRSVVSIYRGGTLAVICTGMGQDGYRGCQDVREQGGQVVAQDEATSVVWGMPGFVAKGGLAHAVLPLSEIPGEILRRVALRRAARAG